MEELSIQPLQINKLLVGLELGTPDEAILDYIDQLASQVQIKEAYFLHVIPSPPSPQLTAPDMAEKWSSDFELKQEVVETLKKRVEQRFEKNDLPKWQVDIQEGNPLETLLNAARDFGADYVLIGQKTKDGYHGILASRLARKIQGDAFIVPDQAKAKIEKILVPIDFSGNSIRALQKAIALKECMHQAAEITVLNIYELPNFSVYRTSRTPEQWEKMAEHAKLEALDIFLYSNAKPYKDQIRKAAIKKDLPGVAHYIHKYAQKEGTDLIVMGAKGHTKIELVLIGSVTEKLLSDADRIPVWVVK